jgi:PAS domain S-box-containing protein
MQPERDQAFFETILSSIADGVFTVDRDWRITSFNCAAERITGVPAEQAIGRRCSDVFHADICERGCALRQTLETNSNLIEVPARILSSPGRSVPISVSTAVLRDASGTLLGAVETFRDLSAIERLRREIDHQYTFEDIVGRSRAFRRIFALLPDIAESDATVLIEGPSGSGKELLARAVHNLSPRRNRPYVVVNCGTLPTALFESELFGYVQGAFTDAKRDKPGRITLAEGGTIVFDEVADLPPATQVKLLRVLQEREYEPLGGLKTAHANVRVVASTNKRLAELVSDGRFRDDLYFRLSVVRLSIPPLRERREDVPYLVEHFVQRFNAKRGKHIAGLTPAAMEVLMRHDFPGNVRELENMMERAVALAGARSIGLGDLPDAVSGLTAGPLPNIAALPEAGCHLDEVLNEVERRLIVQALDRTGGVRKTAAGLLGITFRSLRYRLAKHALADDAGGDDVGAEGESG